MLVEFGKNMADEMHFLYGEAEPRDGCCSEEARQAAALHAANEGCLWCW